MTKMAFVSWETDLSAYIYFPIQETQAARQGVKRGYETNLAASSFVVDAPAHKMYICT